MSDDDLSYTERNLESICDNTIKFMEISIEKAIQNHIKKGTFDKYLNEYLKEYLKKERG